MLVPKLRQLRTNITELDLGHGASVYFSYETPLALCAPGIGVVVNAECAAYSRTSAKHRTVMGWKERPHLPPERFLPLLEACFALDFAQPQATKTLLKIWEEHASPRLGA